MPEESPASWHHLIAVLNKLPTDYLVVGGAALALHGLPRTTTDIDVFVPGSRENAEMLISSLEKQGLNCHQKHLLKIPEEHLWYGQWLCFSAGEDGLDILDVCLCDPDDYKAWSEEIELLPYATETAPVLSLQGIRKIKAKINRPVDQADVALIDEILEAEAP